MRGVARGVGRVGRGVVRALRARPGFVLALAALVFTLDLVLPPLVLSLTRKPWTYATVNPWLRRLPEYLGSSAPLGEKLDFLSRVAVFWVTAEGPYGVPEWGFSVDTMDLVRFALTAGLVAVYFALWLEARARAAPACLAPRACGAGGGTARATGIAGALVGTLGLTTGPCSVVGCGAPVLPVVGLVFAGLSSGTLALLSWASRVSVAVVLGALALGTVYLAWRVGERSAPATAAPATRG